METTLLFLDGNIMRCPRIDTVKARRLQLHLFRNRMNQTSFLAPARTFVVWWYQTLVDSVIFGRNQVNASNTQSAPNKSGANMSREGSKAPLAYIRKDMELSERCDRDP